MKTEKDLSKDITDSLIGILKEDLDLDEEKTNKLSEKYGYVDDPSERSSR